MKNTKNGSEIFCNSLAEVQFMPRFEEVLNCLLRINNIDVYITGSNSKLLSSDIITEFLKYIVEHRSKSSANCDAQLAEIRLHLLIMVQNIGRKWKEKT